LASHVLGRVTRRLSADWQRKYGHPLWLLETFVERDRFAGTCYQAANWVRVGQTQGRTRQDGADAYSDVCRTLILKSVGQGSDFCRTPFRLLSDRVPVGCRTVFGWHWNAVRQD